MKAARGGEFAKYVVLPAKVEEICRREILLFRFIICSLALKNAEQARGIGIRQRCNQDCVNDAEDGNCCANSQRQRQNNGKGKATTLYQSTKRLPKSAEVHSSKWDSQSVRPRAL